MKNDEVLRQQNQSFKAILGVKIMRKDKVIKQLDKLKEEHPNQEIIVETPEGTVSLKIGDALIYEGCRGEIVIDSE